MKKSPLFLLHFFLFFGALNAQNDGLKTKLDKLSLEEESKVIAWRRDLHQNPELSNREFRTAEIVAKHLKSLGLEVKTGVAKTGVIGILRGGKPGPVIALRADMDALPVTERVDVPFASKVKGESNGVPTGIMHACGHDSHTAILMGTAEVLSKVKNEIKGTVVFLFQPSEEGAPKGETGGAGDMIKEGCLANPKVEVIFGLHIASNIEAGKIEYRSGGDMASSDKFSIKVKGKGSHGASPWAGVDPIVTAAMIVTGLQTVVNRQLPINAVPGVVTVGMIQGGNRENIIPEEVNMLGTIRCFDKKVQAQMHENVKRTATKIAESQGATAEVNIEIGNPVTYNNPELTERMVSSLQDAAGKANLQIGEAYTGAEDFAKYQEVVPGLFFHLGGMTKGKDKNTAPSHHTPDFYLDESGFVLGVKAFCRLVVDYGK
jgi:amidohydrolase